MSVQDLQPSRQGMLVQQVTWRPPETLRVNPNNARVHSKRQIKQIARSVQEFGHLVPIIIDESSFILVGHGRLAAAQHLGLRSVPTLQASGLSDAQKRAFMIADNKLTENSGWDREKLAGQFSELIDLLQPIGLDLTVTGFDTGEIDQIFADHDLEQVDRGDLVPPFDPVAVSRRGDLWQMGRHRLLAGDARSRSDVERLMNGELARMAFTDPPFNVKIHGHVQGRGRIKHREFAFASGEMADAEFVKFLEEALCNIAVACQDGAIVFACMDWRHLGQLLEAARSAFSEYKNLVVWNKTSAGQGTFYRSQHELIGVFKVGTAEHVNTFGLGQHGRSRSNIWVYPGANSFHAGRQDELAMHPTVKPVALVADAIRDCSMKGDVVLDTFLGSGTTIMAAEKVGRRGFGLEYDPAYVDVAVRRWQAYTKRDAILDGDGRTFDEIASARASEAPAKAPGLEPVQQPLEAS